MSEIKLIDHPVASTCVKVLRNRKTMIKDFRQAMNILGLLLAVEACRDLKTVEEQIVTPLDTGVTCKYVRDERVLLVPVLRAGLGLVDSFITLLPSARISHIGMYRDHETLEVRPYLNTIPKNGEEFDHIIVLDPMLATGNSAVQALEFLMQQGYKSEQITFVCALAAQPGLNRIQDKFPDIKIITAAIDPGLNEKAYIVPGLGDAGDRLYCRNYRIVSCTMPDFN